MTLSMNEEAIMDLLKKTMICLTRDSERKVCQ